MFDFNEEYQKFLKEQKDLHPESVCLPNGTIVEMQYDEETENNIRLYRMRQNLKSLVFHLGNNKSVSFVHRQDELMFLKEYKEFIRRTTSYFPSFIFDDFDAEKFGKCAEYKREGHSLMETEEYYINEIKNNENNSSKKRIL